MFQVRSCNDVYLEGESPWVEFSSFRSPLFTTSIFWLQLNFDQATYLTQATPFFLGCSSNMLKQKLVSVTRIWFAESQRTSFCSKFSRYLSRKLCPLFRVSYVLCWNSGLTSCVIIHKLHWLLQLINDLCIRSLSKEMWDIHFTRRCCLCAVISVCSHEYKKSEILDVVTFMNRNISVCHLAC